MKLIRNQVSIKSLNLALKSYFDRSSDKKTIRNLINQIAQIRNQINKSNINHKFDKLNYKISEENIKLKKFLTSKENKKRI